MIPFRKEKGIAAAAIGIVSSAILAPDASGREVVSPAVGPQIDAGQTGSCTTVFNNNINCFAYGWMWQLNGDGAAARFDVRNYTAPDVAAWGHTNHALWLGVDNSPPWFEENGQGRWGDWCEVGWTKGWHGDGNYKQYIAYQVGDEYHDQPVFYPITMGQSYHYQILREYDGKYNMYIDFVDVYDCFADPPSTWVRSGIEHSSPQATAAVNDPRQLQWRDMNLNWHAWDEPSIQQLGPYPRFSWEEFPTHGEDWIQH